MTTSIIEPNAVSDKLPGHLVKDVFETLRKSTGKIVEESKGIDDPEGDERVRKEFARVLGHDEEKN